MTVHTPNDLNTVVFWTSASFNPSTISPSSAKMSAYKQDSRAYDMLQCKVFIVSQKEGIYETFQSHSSKRTLDKITSPLSFMAASRLSTYTTLDLIKSGSISCQSGRHAPTAESLQIIVEIDGKEAHGP